VLSAKYSGKGYMAAEQQLLVPRPFNRQQAFPASCGVQPLDTLAARMQTSQPGEAKGLLHLLREGGIKRAFDGLGISLILTMNPAIQVRSRPRYTRTHAVQHQMCLQQLW